MKISSNVPPPLPPPQPTITIEMTLQEAHIFHSAISVADYSKAQNHYINHRSDFNIHNLQHREKFNKIMYAIANQVGEQLEKF